MNIYDECIVHVAFKLKSINVANLIINNKIIKGGGNNNTVPGNGC